jgi:hypothetical protein
METPEIRAFFPDRHLDSPILDIPLRDLEIIRRDLELYSGNLDRTQISDLPSVRSMNHHDKRRLKEILLVVKSASKLVGEENLSYQPLKVAEYPTFLRTPSQVDRTVLAIGEYMEDAVYPIIRASHAVTTRYAGVSSPDPPSILLSEESLLRWTVEEYYAPFIEDYTTWRVGGNSPIMVRKQGSGSCKYESWGGVISPSLCFLAPSHAHLRACFLTYHQLLMLRDASMMRKNVFVARHVLYRDDMLLEQLICKLLTWQEDCLITYGNQGYELVKSTESLAKAYLTRAFGDPIAGEGDSYSLMIKKVDLKERGIRRSQGLGPLPSQTLAERFHSEVLSRVKHRYQAVELFGLQKMTGHPIIDPYRSARESKDLATAPNRVLPSVAARYHATFCHLFLKAFLKRHHRWPRITFSVEGTRLEALRDLNVLRLKEGIYPLSDWATSSFNKEFDLEYYDNYLELMDDKAISFYRDEIHLQWDSGTPSSSRRLLIELLSRSSFSLRDIIEIIEADEIPYRWKVCSVFPKEREFKLAARMFVMLTLEIRTFFAFHEANIAETILPYFPQITMVDSKVEVHERFLHLTDPTRSDTHIQLFQELDLSSWNLLWRSQIVDRIGQELNNLFGVSNVFTTAHRFFSESVVVCRVAGCRPEGIEQSEPPESDLLHYNHQGGFEGIIQKLWSICTVVMIDIALSSKPVSYSITDQGDNVVLNIQTSRDPEMDLRSQLVTLNDEIIASCEASATAAGHILKPEECLSSSTVLTYSKRVYMGGIDYPTSLKDLSRIHPKSAIDFPSYGAYIDSIFSSCLAAAENARRPERCYWLALIQAATYIIRTNRYRGSYTDQLRFFRGLRESSAIRFQLLCPNELGGLPIQGFYSFMYKGTADHLSKSLASVAMLQDYLPEARQIISLSEQDFLYKRLPTLAMLIQDPYGLPIHKPTSPEDAIAEATLDYLKGATVNRALQDVMLAATDEYREWVLSEIGKIQPFNPVIARDLYDCSILGSVDSLKRMFLKTRTIQTATRLQEDNDIVDVMLLAGKRQIGYISWLVTMASKGERTTGSVYTWVKRLRRRWDSTGVVISGLTAYLPCDFPIKWTPYTKLPGIRVEVRAGGKDIHNLRGPNRPYIGTGTVEKRSEHGYKITGRGYAVSALRTLQSIIAWADYDPGMASLIDRLSLARGGIKLSEYGSLLSGILGGSAGHRYAARGAYRAASIMGTTSAATWITLDSNRCGFLSGTVEDYPIMFQEFFTYLTSITALRWDYLRTKGYIGGTLVIGDVRMEQLLPVSLSLRDPVAGPNFSSRLQLVCDQHVSIQARNGPVWESSLPLHSVSGSDILIPAFTSILRGGLEMARSREGVLDMETWIPTVSIGLPEIAGLGVSHYLDACSVVLLEAVMSTTASKSLSHHFHSSLIVLRLKFGAALLNPLLRYIDHPLILNDPCVKGLFIACSPPYMLKGYGKRLLMTELATRAHRMISNPKSQFFTQRIVVFGSASPGSTFSALILQIRRRLFQGVLLGLMTSNQYHKLMGSIIRVCHEDAIETEADRINRMVQLLNDPEWVSQLSLPSYARSVVLRIQLSLTRHRIYATLLSADEVARRARFSGPIPLVKTRAVHVNRPLITAPLRLSTDEGIVVQPRKMVSPSVSKLQDFYGHRWSLGSIAIRDWLPLSSLFRGKECIIVGSGFGACAVSAIQGGAIRVWGHDLPQDFPTTSNLSNYVPMLVDVYSLPPLYQQTEATLMTSGNWWDPLAARSILRLCTLNSILVIDISSSEGNSPAAFLPLIQQRFVGELLIRVRASEIMHSQVLWSARNLGEVRAIFSRPETSNRVTKVYHLHVSGKATHMSYGRLYATGITEIAPCREIDTTSSLTMFLVAPLGVGTLTTVRETIKNALWAFRTMIGKDHLSVSYSDWTLVLASVAGCEFLLYMDKDDKEVWLENLDREGRWPIITPRLQWLENGAHLRDLLLRVAAPLSESLDRVL